MNRATPKKISFDRAKEKAMRYCMYQERSVYDVEQRLKAWGVAPSKWDEVIDALLKDDFLNEERYVEAYVRGKFFTKKWGRIKIQMGLKKKRISGSLVEKIVRQEIDEVAYEQMIQDLVEWKSNQITETDGLKRRDKIYRFLLGKGFESALIVKHLGEH